MSDMIKIVLTGRRPVLIKETDWPVIASVKWSQGDPERQVVELSVRQHDDGRAIVYGIREHGFDGQRGRKRGRLLASGSDLPPALKDVAFDLGFSDLLAEECMAELPAETLD